MTWLLGTPPPSPPRVAARADAYVIRTEHYSEDVAGLWDWLCVPPDERPAEEIAHTSDYGRKRDTALSDAGRELLTAHLQARRACAARVCGVSLRLRNHATRRLHMRAPSEASRHSHTEATPPSCAFTLPPPSRHPAPSPAAPHPCRQTEYHLKKTVEALADSAYLRDPATRWARTNADASPEEFSCLTACGTLPRVSKLAAASSASSLSSSSSSSSATAAAAAAAAAETSSSADEAAAAAAAAAAAVANDLAEEVAMASSAADACEARLAVAMEAAADGSTGSGEGGGRGGLGATAQLGGAAFVLVVGYLMGRRQGRRQARQELLHGIGGIGGIGGGGGGSDEQRQQLSSGMAGYDLGVNDAALHGARRQQHHGAARVSSEAL